MLACVASRWTATVMSLSAGGCGCSRTWSAWRSQWLPPAATGSGNGKGSHTVAVSETLYPEIRKEMAHRPGEVPQDLRFEGNHVRNFTVSAEDQGGR